MSALKSGIVLDEDESLVVELEAELWATGSNPIAIFFGELNKLFAKLFGYRQDGFVVITNKRVIEVSNQIECYCIKTGKTVRYVIPSSVKEVGYIKSTTCGCFCPAFYFYYESYTQRRSILLKGADDAGAQKIVDAFYNAISVAQKGNA